MSVEHSGEQTQTGQSHQNAHADVAAAPGTAGGGPAGGRPGGGWAGGRLRGGGRRGGGRRGEELMVPPAQFTSYYGRPVVKASPWEADIPAYLFLGGLAGGSSLLAAGADLTGNGALKRPARLTALSAITLSFVALVHDLGKPARFHHMLRVAKPTSPMSVGTWILTGYGPLAGVAGASELSGLVAAALPRRWKWLAAVLKAAGRPAGLAAAAIGPAVASYTAVLVADTATPTWHEGYREMPFLFVGSAAAASGGLGMIVAPPSQAGPARNLALGGALLDLAAEHQMEKSQGLASEPMHEGTPGTLNKAARYLTAAGAVGTLVGRRSRVVSALSGAALLVGSACTRFGLFYAGQESAKDPKYTVVPQRERLQEQGGPTRSV